MLEHRSITIPTWKKLQKEQNNGNNILFAINTIHDSIITIIKLKTLVLEYKWDDIDYILKSNLLTNDLDYSCNIIKNFLDKNDYESINEIGFHWVVPIVIVVH